MNEQTGNFEVSAGDDREQMECNGGNEGRPGALCTNSRTDSGAASPNGGCYSRYLQRVMLLHVSAELAR